MTTMIMSSPPAKRRHDDSFFTNLMKNWSAIISICVTLIAVGQLIRTVNIQEKNQEIFIMKIEAVQKESWELKTRIARLEGAVMEIATMQTDLRDIRNALLKK